MLTGIINAPTTTTTKTDTPSNVMDKNAFLKLLVAQLKNQDPTQSQDPNAMVSQMTSFSTLEQMQNTNSLLSGIQSQNSGLYQAQTASLIGKTVRISSTTLNLSNSSATIGVNLASAATTLLTIKDATGNVVRVLNAGDLKAGNNSVTWDGKDANGNKLPDGPYTVAAVAQGADGKAVTTATNINATVQSVKFVNGAVMITAGGQSYALTDVNEISA
jgi:flagellar basal-body rod modification protein FlgD